MPFIFNELDQRTRELMIEEIEYDISRTRLYEGKFLSDDGKNAWPNLLFEAAKEHDELWLADQIRRGGLLLKTYERKKPGGGVIQAKVPVTASEMLAEGEFNRFYMRAICRKAEELREELVEIYRAKPVSAPRPESEAARGRVINASGLLNDLRTNHEDWVVFNLPSGPNSGLSLTRRQTQ